MKPLLSIIRFDPKSPKDSLERVVKDKAEFGKMRRAVADAYKECANKSGVADVGRDLRRMRGSLMCLGILGAALALNPNSTDAAAFADAISRMNTSVSQGHGISDEDILDATIAVQNLYGSEAPALKIFGDLSQKQ